MYYLVYQITNVLNGKTYIGCHKTQNKDDGYMGSGKLIKRAVKKYGAENFKKDILVEASSSEEMFTKEKQLVTLGPHSYNMKNGGDGGWDHVSRERTPEIRGKISRKLSGRTLSMTARHHQSLGKRGNLNAAKRWRILNPQGNIDVIISLYNYCKIHGLDIGNMTRISPITKLFYRNKGYRIMEKIDG
jgi:hypothetical protein